MTEPALPVVTLTAYDGESGQMTSETYTLVIDGTTYNVERWATDHASGEEWTDEDGSAVEQPYDTAEASDVVDEAISTFGSLFYAKYHERVQPIIDQITAEAIAEASGCDCGPTPEDHDNRRCTHPCCTITQEEPA